MNRVIVFGYHLAAALRTEASVQLFCDMIAKNVSLETVWEFACNQISFAIRMSVRIDV